MTETYSYESIRLSIDLVRHLVDHAYAEGTAEDRALFTQFLKMLSCLDQSVHECSREDGDAQEGVCSECFWEVYSNAG